MIINICDLCGKKMREKEVVTTQFTPFRRAGVLKYLYICQDCFNEILGKAKAIQEAQEHGEGATE